MRIALIGAAHTHTSGYVRAIAERRPARVELVWDDDEGRGGHWAREAGAAHTTSLAQASAAAVDAFVICAENTRHRPLLDAVLPAGKPVLCEKPLAVRSQDARAAARLARAAGAKLLLGYGMPFSAAAQGVRAALAQQRLGAVTGAHCRVAHHAAYGRWFDNPHNQWFTDPELAGGGAFLDLGTHGVHLLRTLLGPVREVFATIDNASGQYPRVDDRGFALLRCASGAVATVEASWVQTGGARPLEITGRAGTITAEGDAYRILAPGAEPVALPPGTARPTGIDRLLAAAAGRLTQAEIDEDLTCAVDAVEVMEACYASAAQGRWVPVHGSGA